jgi:hypothetical protein
MTLEITPFFFFFLARTLRRCKLSNAVFHHKKGVLDAACCELGHDTHLSDI